MTSARTSITLFSANTSLTDGCKSSHKHAYQKEYSYDLSHYCEALDCLDQRGLDSSIISELLRVCVVMAHFSVSDVLALNS